MNNNCELSNGWRLNIVPRLRAEGRRQTEIMLKIRQSSPCVKSRIRYDKINKANSLLISGNKWYNIQAMEVIASVRQLHTKRRCACMRVLTLDDGKHDLFQQWRLRQRQKVKTLKTNVGHLVVVRINWTRTF